jgi:hypothetical protein
MVEISHNILAAVGGIPRPSTDVVVETTDVEKWFGKTQVLNGISLTVKRAEVVVMIGASMMLPRAVMWGNRLKRWKTIPMSWRWRAMFCSRSSTSLPLTSR